MQNVFVATKAVIINKSGKILTIRRSATDPHRPLTWDLPGGEVEVGEELEDSLRREIKEETGMEVDEPKLHGVIGRFNQRQEYWVTIAYVIKSKTDEVVLSSEHDEYRWVTKEEFLGSNATDRQKEFISKVV